MWLRFVAITSAALGAGILVLWVRSHVRHDTWSVERRQVAGSYWKAVRSEFHSVRGRLVWSEVDERHQPLLAAPPTGAATVRATMDDQLPWADAPREGVRWRSDGDLTQPPSFGNEAQWGGGAATHRLTRTRVDVSYGLVALALALPALALPLVRTGMARYRRRRWRAGRCPACGYDLRATPDRCPECGCVPNQSDRTA